MGGPFQQVNVNVGRGLKAGGLSIEWSGGTWVLSYGGPFGIPTGVGIGGAVSSYPTYTWPW
jgi:hypothetical protein